MQGGISILLLLVDFCSVLVWWDFSLYSLCQDKYILLKLSLWGSKLIFWNSEEKKLLCICTYKLQGSRDFMLGVRNGLTSLETGLLLLDRSNSFQCARPGVPGRPGGLHSPFYENILAKAPKVARILAAKFSKIYLSWNR